VFATIKGVVTDIGGMMCHAAIVCREYGLPAVVGTGFATSTVDAGQVLRVDGDRGRVEILG
jgi:pyruvate, water dikinase